MSLRKRSLSRDGASFSVVRTSLRNNDRRRRTYNHHDEYEEDLDDVAVFAAAADNSKMPPPVPKPNMPLGGASKSVNVEGDAMPPPKKLKLKLGSRGSVHVATDNSATTAETFTGSVGGTSGTTSRKTSGGSGTTSRKPSGGSGTTSRKTSGGSGTTSRKTSSDAGVEGPTVKITDVSLESGTFTFIEKVANDSE